MIRQLHEVLKLDRPLIGLDEETTGVNPKTSGIVEIAFEIFMPGEPVKEYRTLVNPCMRIPPEATKIHGITNEMVKDAPTFAQLADNFLKGLGDCDFAGYNVWFDLRQLMEEFKRCGKVWSYEGARIIDGYRLWQISEGRTLEDAVNHWLGSKHDRSNDAELDAELTALDGSGVAHNALWDIKMSTRIIAAQLGMNDKLPKDIEALHQLQWPGRFDAEGKLAWRGDSLAFTFGEHKDKPLNVVPRSYLSWVVGKDFSDKVKDVCRAAMKGSYPTPPVKIDAEELDA